MAAPVQSALRRWKRFVRAFDSVDDAIEAADPVLYSRQEFRLVRSDIVKLLCNATDDDHAERLCLVLDDVMAEFLETLSLVPAMPTVLATTDLAKSVRALRKHESERVRVLASGIVSGWRASMQDDLAKVREALHKLDNVPQSKEIGKQQVPEATTKQPEPSAKKRVQDDNSSVGAAQHKLDNVPEQQAPAAARTKQPVKIPETFAKNTVEMAKASDPATVVVRGDHRAELCYEERMEAAKRKFHDGYKEAEDAKRQRRTQKVVAPEMLKQRQKMHPRSRASCASSMVKKTFTVTRLAS